MDTLERILGHDAWATRELFRLCRGETGEQLDRPFGLGWGSLRATLVHLVEVM